MASPSSPTPAAADVVAADPRPGSTRVFSAYMLFANEARMQYADPSLDLKSVAKLVLDRWAALTDAERQAYEQRAAEERRRQEAEREAKSAVADANEDGPEEDPGSTDAGVEHEQAPGAQKEGQAPDTEPQQVTPAKRKRTATAYALFAIDEAQRSKAAEQCQAAGLETGAKQIAVALKEMWKVMSNDEKVPYEELRERARVVVAEEPAAKQAAGDTAKADAAEAVPEEAEKAEQGDTVTPAKAPSKKRTRDGGPSDSATKRGRAAGKQLEAAEPAIDEALLQEARSLGFECSLKNLAGRSEVLAKGSSAQEMLHALKMAEGLVNKAKQLLLGI